jgi:hypothetical protein
VRERERGGKEKWRKAGKGSGVNGRAWVKEKKEKTRKY